LAHVGNAAHHRWSCASSVLKLGGERGLAGPAALPLNTWTHLAGTYDGVALRLYVNSALVASQAFTGSIVTSTGALRLGGNNVWGEYFQGRLDEIRIYNRALSAGELQADMTTPVGGGTPPPNTPPTISTIAAQTVNEDTATGPLAFTVGDAETAASSLTLSASSSNPPLAPTSSIVFGGAGANRTVTVTPAANQNGGATITLTVSDGQLSTSTSFPLTVTAVNDPPTITSLANQTTTAGTAVGPLPFTVGDLETAAASLSVTGSSSNPAVVPDGNIALGGAGANRTVTLTPAAGQTGTTTITLTVSDGLATSSTAFQLTVTATPSGLVAAYSFNEGAGPTVTDSSGNNNTGTLGAGVTWTTAGRFGSALVFNGSSLVTVPASPSLNLSAGMTLEAWVYPTASLTSWRTALMKEQTGTFTYALYAGSPGNGPSAFINVGTTGSGERGVSAPASLPVNTWSHVAGTYDGATLRVYVNGGLVASQAVVGAPAASPGALRIGGNTIWGEYFQGRIDEVRIYTRALSQGEIQNDMTGAISGPPPDTTPPTVAVTSPVAGSTVFGTVSVSAAASDDVAIAAVQFFVDGALLGGPVTAPPYAVLWDTTSTTGDHVLTAAARDLAGNTSTSASVTVTVTQPDPSLVGQWGNVSDWPIVPVHATLLSTGQVLASDGQGLGQDARVWNPVTNTFTSAFSPGTNIFCAGHCGLPDGRVLVVGGHSGAHVGVPDANIFTPSTGNWTQMQPMAYQRWYPTATALPDGRVIVTSGEDNCNGCYALIPEIYSPQTNTWTQLSGASLSLPYYPHVFVLPDGRVLVSSTSEDSIVSQVLDIGAQTWSVVDPIPVDGGSATMFLPGLVMKSGTSADPDLPSRPSAATTYVLDTTQPSPIWEETAPMAYPRTYHDLTLLPDGNVLATGGGTTTDPVDPGGAVRPAELWSPATRTWTTMASLAVARLYHSIALLLPDARVLVAGGGRFFDPGDPSDQLNAEIFSPPYLFKGPRPVITSAPATANYGVTITVQTPDAARVAAVSLIRLSSVTHAFNADQRFVPLQFTIAAALNVQMPSSPNLAPPGYYMLFIVDTNGVPSVASFVKLQ